MPRRGALAIALVLGFLAALPAHAQSDPALQAARQHFDAGVRAYDKGDYETALVEFRAAYAQKSSPAILRNIALCLAKLDRNAEAIDAIERMLAEGGPEIANIRAPAENTLRELRAKAATIRLHVVFHLTPGTTAPEARVDVDGELLTPRRVLEPIWVDPGSHRVSARAPGFLDASQTISVAAGERDVDVTLSLVPEPPVLGSIHVETNVPASIIKIDGVVLGHGTWQGELPAGRHRVEADASGWIGVIQDVDVQERSQRDVSLELRPEPRRGLPPIPTLHLWYFGASIGLFGGELPAKGGGLGLVSFTFDVRLGRRYGHHFAIEIDGELVRGTAEVTREGQDVRFVHTHAAIGPGIRFLTSDSSPRLTAAAIGGVLNQNIDKTTLVRGMAAGATSGGTPTAFLHIEGGGQVDFGRTFGLELAAFIGMMGMNHEDLTSSVMARYGGRIALLFSF
jgi:hypothetical protein